MSAMHAPVCPCPFCGKVNWAFIDDGVSWIECASCGATGPAVTSEAMTKREAKSETVDAWNRQFQNRVAPWMGACFGEAISRDQVERNHRFLEESLELVQACGCTAGEARQLVDYVYGRAVGEPPQEVGGVMVTLAALCLAHGLDMHKCGETELKRIWTKVDEIRAKQAAKPRNSPLPS